MDMRKVLIADRSSVFSQELTRRLDKTCMVRSCDNGLVASELLESFRPDVVVLDLILPGQDGIALIQSIHAGDRRVGILVTSKIITPIVERIIEEGKIDYFMYRPCEFQVLADRICEIADTLRGDIIMPSGADRRIIQLLGSLGLSPNHKGFGYLCYGIERYEQMPGLSMTGDLYPEIGRHFITRSEAVEHDIRRAIFTAWQNADPAVWSRYFPTFNGMVPRPTNTVFIRTLAQCLSNQHSRYA